MKATLSPTSELFLACINGVNVPTRIWRGTTEGGIQIEAYILSVTPVSKQDHGMLKSELPDFMKPSRETFAIGHAK